MNFSTFPVATTTIFPISNSVAGGQLVTEWNLRSRDFVGSCKDVEYDYAVSYVHSEDDFSVRVQQDDTGTVLSNSTLEILPGTAVLNGHYVKQESHMFVDLLKANDELRLHGLEPLTGKLGVGLRVYYSTESTMVGAMMPENDQDVYEGVQVVVLPESQLKTPEECPSDEYAVTCHLKLATFTFLDNEIRGVSQNPDKIKYIDADRITNVDRILDENYLSGAGINPKKLYVLAGKSYNNTVRNTWCDATDSLMVWDSNPVRTESEPEHKSAAFVSKPNGVTSLVVPHKCVDGMKVSMDLANEGYNKSEYYRSVELDLPVADFSTNSSGTVDASYTKRVKDISNRVDKFFKLIKGKQVAYISVLESLDALPDINSNWNVGDYVLVDVDTYALAAQGSSTYVRPPSTMYAVLPGQVQAVKFFGTGAVNSDKVPEGLSGVRIGSVVEKEEKPITSKTVMSEDLKLEGSLGDSDIVPSTVKYTTPEGIVYQDNGQGELVYSEENDDENGNPTVLEASVLPYESESSQKFSLSEQSVGHISGYAISCGDQYLTVTKSKPFKLYFGEELTEYCLFSFIDSDNKTRLTGKDINDIVTVDKSKRKIRPVEIVSMALVLQEQIDGTNLLTDVQELVAKVSELTDSKSSSGIPHIKSLVDDVMTALETADADTAVSLASELKDTVDRVFDSDTDKNKTVRNEVDEAKKAVDAAAADDTSSVQERVEAVNEAYDALESFVSALEKNMEQLNSLVGEVKKQVDATKVGGTDYNIYGRVTAYSKDETTYVYISENKDVQEQMWQVLETDSQVSIFNSFYGLALSQQDAKSLRETKYIIDYNTGSISGLPMIGSASYNYYSSNILSDLLNYFSVTGETHGVQGEDYFVYRYRMDESNYQDYYYVVSQEGSRSWSDAIWLTGTVALATTEMVGGFLNVPDTALDGGYVKLNDEGYLQLVDYGLLRTGAAAYQLGENVEISEGLSSSDVQSYLDEYVNNRVAFPNSSQISKAAESASSGTYGVYCHPEVIHVTVDLSKEDSEYEVKLENIDSRFGSCVFLHITGSADSSATVRISNVEKLRIDQNIQGEESDPPRVVIDNCCMYYDADVLNKIAKCNQGTGSTGMSNVSFWYQKYESSDPDIVVNDMTVSEVNAPVVTDVIDFWNATSPNDNHYHVALHSVTFSHEGYVTGAGMLVANDSTSNVHQGHFICAANFELPQGSGLSYPAYLVNRPLKFTGTFESGYQSDGGFVVQDTKFSALTQSYNLYDNSDEVKGSILFHVDANIVQADFGGVSTEAWEPDTFHLFYGAAM